VLDCSDKANVMADTTTHHGATGTTNASDTPQHLNTNIESGHFNEKEGGPSHDAPPATKGKPLEDEEEDEDMDALIDELESQDGHAEDEEEEDNNPATGRTVPEDQLNTDTRTGLTEQEVTLRRKKYGLNQMAEEKENMFLKFLSYFVGPIQFVMEVSVPFCILLTIQWLVDSGLSIQSHHKCLA
jgi:H+-transporting ATPase